MAAGISRKGDFKTHDRAVRLSLTYHAARTAALVATGMAADTASKQAFADTIALGNKGLLKLHKAGKL